MSLELNIAGQHIWLLPGYAAWWAERKTLLVADLHLGRSGAFRQAGLGLPEGADAEDLARLSALISQHNAERLLILGDLFHARAGMTRETTTGFDAWLGRQTIPVCLIEGNHDRRSRPYGLSAPLQIVEDCLVESPFCFAHEPVAKDGLFTIAGHLHPGVRLKDAAGCTHRSKSFWKTDALLVLPAFGSLTSGASLPGRSDGRHYPCTLEAVFPPPGQRHRSKLQSEGQ